MELGPVPPASRAGKLSLLGIHDPFHGHAGLQPSASFALAVVPASASCCRWAVARKKDAGEVAYYGRLAWPAGVDLRSRHELN